VSGSVKNSKSNESVAAVSVTVKSGTAGAYTDEHGNFKFTTTQKAPFTLVVSSVGFKTKEVTFTGSELNVDLDISYALGDEIVVAASRVPERI
ncbi:carboxypeptidase-like regulatory domain-containing protein, partial [Enterococcus faecium]|uniref:carboxypeptidase-like regulatory domain-containing protein n=1 Tax=Enterococcus faecium TaxID=1352 RepID=UPI0034E974C9